jgi:hypothetical protein
MVKAQWQKSKSGDIDGENEIGAIMTFLVG